MLVSFLAPTLNSSVILSAVSKIYPEPTWSGSPSSPSVASAATTLFFQLPPLPHTEICEHGTKSSPSLTENSPWLSPHVEQKYSPPLSPWALSDVASHLPAFVCTLPLGALAPAVPSQETLLLQVFSHVSAHSTCHHLCSKASSDTITSPIVTGTISMISSRCYLLCPHQDINSTKSVVFVSSVHCCGVSHQPMKYLSLRLLSPPSSAGFPIESII